MVNGRSKNYSNKAIVTNPLQRSHCKEVTKNLRCFLSSTHPYLHLMYIQIIQFLFGEFLTNTGNKYNNNYFFRPEPVTLLSVIVPTSQAPRYLEASFLCIDQKAVIIASNYVNTQYPIDYILPLSTLQSNEHMPCNLLRNRLPIQSLKHGHLNHLSEV